MRNKKGMGEMGDGERERVGDGRNGRRGDAGVGGRGERRIRRITIFLVN